MEREEIIDDYIRYMRIAARLSDDVLRRAISEVVDEYPELLEKMEYIISKKKDISQVETEDKTEADQESDLVNIFDNINEALPIVDMENDLTQSGYTNSYEIIYNSIRDDIIYIDGIEPDGTIYLALTDKGEALWELTHF